MTNSRLSLPIGFLLVLCHCLPLSASDIFVASNGLDSNQGTKTSPVQTLARGCELATLQIKSKGYPAEGITIWVKGGNYSYAGPISLRQAFSDTAEWPLTI